MYTTLTETIRECTHIFWHLDWDKSLLLSVQSYDCVKNEKIKAQDDIIIMPLFYQIYNNSMINGTF